MRTRTAASQASTRRKRAARSRPPVRLALEALEARWLMSADGFLQTNLVSNLAGIARSQDPNLVNPWGLTSSPTSPFWVANQGSGTSTLYNASGVKQALTVNIPPAPGSTEAHGSPTGIAFNGTGQFMVSETDASGKTHTGSALFLFDGLDGVISGWAPGADPTNAIIAVNNSGKAVYTGLALVPNGPGGGPELLAANRKGTIDAFDGNFKPVTTLPAGAFTDPTLPAGYAPFNVQFLGGKVFVTYSKGGANSPGNGFIDEYDTDGSHMQRFASGGDLAAPWGLVVAPQDFGKFGGDLLVGNFGDGRITAFNLSTQQDDGQLTDALGNPLVNGRLWSLRFGNGGAAGDPDTLYFTAGIGNQADGLFGQITPVAPENAATTNDPLIPRLSQVPAQTFSTVPPNGDQNPYGVAFVPQGFHGSGDLQSGDILVSNFNNAANVQGTGTTIERITPDGKVSTFFQDETGMGLTTALGVLKNGFVIVGEAPATTAADGVTPTVGQGDLLVLDAEGNVVKTISDPSLQGPWDLTIHDEGSTADVFVSNVLTGTVTRLDLSVPDSGHGAPTVLSTTQIASGFKHGTDPNALVVGPTGLAFDDNTDTLYVASTKDNAVFAISNAEERTTDAGTGTLIYKDAEHLHGPLGLVLAPNGNLLTANGDAVNADPNQTNEVVEFTPQGEFVAQFQVDLSGTSGGAFGLAAGQFHGKSVVATVNDVNNTLELFTVGEQAQPTFTQTNLTSDVVGIAQNQDSNLVNPWGLALNPNNGIFWAADQGKGVATLYNAQGQPQSLVVQVPAPPGKTASNPTGEVFNGTGLFNVSETDASGTTHTGSALFLFASLDGTISGWAPGVDLHQAILEVNNSGKAVYTGLTLATGPGGQPLLYAANRFGSVDVFDSNFKPVDLGPSAFKDPTLPAGYAPFNVQAINGDVFVTYSKGGANSPGDGFIDEYSANGTLEQQFAAGGTLAAPWGLVVAPKGFGSFGGDLLVGNFGDGTINAFNLKTGAFEGQLKDAAGNPIVNGRLWTLAFGNGQGGTDPNTLYFTAGIGNEQHGLFGAIQMTPPQAGAGDPALQAAVQQLVSDVNALTSGGGNVGRLLGAVFQDVATVATDVVNSTDPNALADVQATLAADLSGSQLAALDSIFESLSDGSGHHHH